MTEQQAGDGLADEEADVQARTVRAEPARSPWDEASTNPGPAAEVVTVVIPALNEAMNLPHVLPRIPAGVLEVILVDGDSTDRTREVAQELRPDLRIVRQTGRGKGAALRSGFESSTGDIIIMLDADGSMDPTEIPRFLEALNDGADLVKGSRFLKGGGTRDMPLVRRLGNAFFVNLVNALFGSQYSDLCYGYCAFRRSRMPELCIESDGFEIETMLNIRAARAEWRVTEVPSFEAARLHGAGRLRTLPDGWRVLTSILREAVDQFTGHDQAALESTPGVAVQEAT